MEEDRTQDKRCQTDLCHEDITYLTMQSASFKDVKGKLSALEIN